jgi:hypothetical protein
MQDETICIVDVAAIAATAGDPRCLEVALAHGHQASYPEAMAAAVAGGYVECVTLLREHGNTSVTADTLTTAAKRGHVECVQYIAPVLRESGMATGPNGRAIRRRPQRGPRGSPRQSGVPRVCNAMAEQGELIALQTLVQGGCAKYMDWKTLWAACRGRSRETIGYTAHPAPCFV